LQNSLRGPNSMIASLVLVSRKATYPTGYRRFARNPNPAKQARIWTRIGVLQLAHFIVSQFLRTCSKSFE